MWSLQNKLLHFIFVKGTIKIFRAEADQAVRVADRNDKQIIFKKLTFADCTNEINNTQIDDAKGIGAVMST